MISRYRKAHRIKRKKSILKSRFFWLTFLILIIFGAVFYLLIFSPFFQVKKIVISGEERISDGEIRILAERKLEKKVLFFPTKSIFLINLKNIKNEILQGFPQIADIKINRDFPDTLSVIVVERLEVANFCQNDTCFLLDKEGVIFEESEPKAELIKIIDGQKEKMPKLGKQIIERDYLEKILKIKKYLFEELKLGTKEFLVFNQRLNVKTDEDWEIYFDPGGDLNWQLTKLNLVLKEKIPSEKRKDLEYIELRFGDLAAFRYREK
jgi:cell division septal protein FtsQ